ncbi:hypothetical protein H7691_06765 [Stenotrophomonas sp. CW117]|uniref:hypothetical protein n=1 Tax=Stenotrophomonas TaxID=40323 RepID=UPI00177CE333|nr:hypothetical protein [Stenotrophomonas sp. CW117]QOF99808.1 hypothetical protein H7691_06765 [Stenotrophomonas sp. CW117]
MADKRFADNPQLAALAGTEVIPATSIDAGTDTASNPVAAGTDVGIPVRQLLGLKVQAVVIASGVATVDCGHGLHRNHTLTLTGNVTLALANLAPAGYATEGEIRIVQDATGGRTLTLPPPFKPLGGSDTAVKSAASSVTILSFKTMNDGTTVEYAMQESA